MRVLGCPYNQPHSLVAISGSFAVIYSTNVPESKLYRTLESILIVFTTQKHLDNSLFWGDVEE